MKRVRPHIPWSVRYIVITRQVHAAGLDAVSDLMAISAKVAAQTNIRIMFGDQKVHLDHNPALRTRPYNPRIKNVAARYTPNANDSEYLLYRTDTAHRLKTNVKGDGAQFPDRVLIKRERKRERQATAKPTANTRPLQNRSNWPPKGTRAFQSRRL